MKWSRAHIPTLRDVPQEAEVVSHQLMLRAGMIRKLAAGIYSFLPLGWKSILKMNQILREELSRAGCEEVQLPFVQPKELWEESGRWSLYAKELARLTDRHDNEFCLQPTSEEAITDLVRRDVKSYRQLPMTLYQIQTKFRDEIRPRFGIMRGREFIMKDAYSFDLKPEGAIKSYEEMRKAYRRIFSRAGLQFKSVEADTGAIGGTKSEEFSVLASSGEDEIVSCPSCTYGANQEKATSKLRDAAGAGSAAALEKFATPGLKSIDDLAKSLNVPTSELVKTMIATDSEARCIVVLIRGDHELHELKLQSLLSAQKGLKGVRLASEQELQHWKLPKGSLGPVQFPIANAIVVVDSTLSRDKPAVVGANEEGFHFKNVLLSRDAKIDLEGVIHHVRAGEPCPNCGSPLEIFRGIEVGHVFYLGLKYSKAMKLEVSGEDGKLAPVEMGCYGIGVGRTVAACIEQNHDAQGIKWPIGLAPYELVISSLGEGGAPAAEAERIYNACLEEGIDVIWDDRALSPGVKLKDAELIGIPFQLIIGEKGLKNSQVEWKVRETLAKEFIPLASAQDHVIAAVRNARKELLNRARDSETVASPASTRQIIGMKLIMKVLMLCLVATSIMSTQSVLARIAVGGGVGADMPLARHSQVKNGVSAEGFVRVDPYEIRFHFSDLGLLDTYSVVVGLKHFFVDTTVRPFVEAAIGPLIVANPRHKLSLGFKPEVTLGVDLGLTTFLSMGFVTRYSAMVYFGGTDAGWIELNHGFSILGNLTVWF